MSNRVRAILFGTLICSGVSGCFRFWRTEPNTTRNASGHLLTTVLKSPVKAHLTDGSTIIFPAGATVDSMNLSGEGGQWYPFLQDTFVPRRSVRLDSLVGFETFDKKLLVAPTAVTSVAATALGSVGTVALLKAIFGSCPTVYADTADGADPVLQAEGFSYSIAPLFENRDVDALKVHPGADGRIRLELRNEALETHFINHLELLEVRHADGDRAIPDQSGLPVVVGGLRALALANDRAGRDVRKLLGAIDNQLYATAPSIVGRATVQDLDDWIDIAVDDLPPGDSIAVVLRLRNSLLNTVLLYEGLLGGRDGADYLATAGQTIASAIDLSRWYVETMGLRATVAGSPRARSGADGRIGDVGPIAFRDVAIILPRPTRDARSVRVRLAFVADNWRIDRAEIAGRVVRPEVRSVPVEQIIAPRPAKGAGPVVDTAAMRATSAPDERYLETLPGQRMTLVFRSPPSPETSTYFIAWQGYYTEWIRGSWLAHPVRTEPFVLGNAAVLSALRRWDSQRVEMERVFYSTKIPVR